MIFIFWIIFFSFFIQSIFWYSHLFSSFKWLKNSRFFEDKKSEKEIIVLIPVLDEMKRLPETLKYFLNKFKELNLKIVIITTEKERELKNKPCFDTIEFSRKMSFVNPRVIHYHYPSTSGKMAHQLNYGIKKLSEEVDLNSVFLAVYNADSQPHAKTFDWVLGMASKNKKIQVFQQYGDYTKNLYAFNGFFQKSILISVALQQTQWSVGAEIFRALKQFKIKNNKNIFKAPFNHCIGHGLIFTKDIFDKVGGFSEESHNEDAIFGLKLSYFRETIMPIPFFDLSDTPDTVGGLIQQRKNWYFGPMQAFYYYKEIIKEDVDGKINKKRLYILCCKLFRNAINWALGSFFCFLSLIIVIFNFSKILLLAFIVEIFCYLIIPELVVYFYIIKNNLREIQDKKINIIFFVIFGSIFNYFLYGLSAYWAIFEYMRYIFFKKDLKKEKTKMT